MVFCEIHRSNIMVEKIMTKRNYNKLVKRGTNFENMKILGLNRDENLTFDLRTVMLAEVQL